MELIQEHRPRFNVQHALSMTYSFFGLRSEANEVALRLGMDETTSTGETLIGAFKNRGLCRRALFAIGRTLWNERNQSATIYDLPIWLMDRTKRNLLRLAGDRGSIEELIKLLEGSSPDFTKRAQKLSAVDSHLRKLQELDLITLTEFFDLAVRMRKLRERSGKEVLPQQEVDRQAIITLARDLPADLPTGVGAGMDVQVGEAVS